MLVVIEIVGLLFTFRSHVLTSDSTEDCSSKLKLVQIM